MTDVPKDLLELETAFWTGDEAFFRAHTDDECLVAFAEMPGVMARDKIAATARDHNRWRGLKIEPKGFLKPTDDIAMLTYEADATRGNGESYAALVSTGYVRRGNEWKMMFHNHTPH